MPLLWRFRDRKNGRLEDVTGPVDFVVGNVEWGHEANGVGANVVGEQTPFAGGCNDISRAIAREAHRYQQTPPPHFRHNRTTLASFRQLGFNIRQPDLPNRLHRAEFTIVHDRNR